LLEGCLAHVQQPNNVPLPAALPGPAPRRVWWPPIIRSKRVLAMIVAWGVGLLGVVLLSTEPPDIAGQWSGEEWGKAVVPEKPMVAGYRLTLSNGFTCEAVAVARNPRGKAMWWRPDGTPVEEPLVEILQMPRLDEMGAVPPIVPENEFLCCMRWSLPNEVDGHWRNQVTFVPHPTVQESGAIVRDPSRPELGRFPADLICFKEPPDTISIRVAVAAGPWEPVATFDGKNTRELVPNAMIVCSTPSVGPNNRDYQFQVMHNLDRDAYSLRMIARLKDGKEQELMFHSGPLTGNPAKGFTLMYPQEVGPEDIKEYVLERTPWVRGEIKDISLRPRQKTSVQVIRSGKPADAVL
jgi:hypothetical protein